MSDDSAPSAHSGGPIVRSTLARSHCAKCREETLHKAGRCIHCTNETRKPRARTSVGDALIEARFSGRPMSLSDKRKAVAERKRRWREEKKKAAPTCERPESPEIVVA